MVDYFPTEDVVVSSTSYTYALDNNTVYHIGKHAERTHDVHVRNQWMVFSVLRLNFNFLDRGERATGRANTIK